jgi:hypothetical protein
MQHRTSVRSLVEYHSALFAGGNPGGETELFVRVKRGVYRLR